MGSAINKSKERAWSLGVKSTANVLDMGLKSNRFQDMSWPEYIRHWMEKPSWRLSQHDGKLIHSNIHSE
jgi:hypothetical protein